MGKEKHVDGNDRLDELVRLEIEKGGYWMEYSGVTVLIPFNNESRAGWAEDEWEKYGEKLLPRWWYDEVMGNEGA